MLLLIQGALSLLYTLGSLVLFIVAMVLAARHLQQVRRCSVEASIAAHVSLNVFVVLAGIALDALG